MTASLIVVALGAVAAAVGTGGLTARCSRAPSLFLAAWTAALFFLAVALAAQALGYVAGYSDLIFRANELGSQALAPLLLCLGLVELLGRSVVGRFAMRLAVCAIGVVVLVILGTDPLSPAATLSTSWPDPAVVYQLVPTGLIRFLAVFAIITALIAGIAVLARSGRGGEYAAQVRPGLAGAAAAGVIALPGLAMLAGTSAGSTGFALAIVVAAALTWYAANTAARAGLTGGAAGAAGDGRGAARDDWAQGAGRLGDDALSRYSAGGQRDRGYGDDAGYDGEPGYGRPGRSIGEDSDIRYPALAALAAERAEPPGGYDGDEYDSARFDSAQFDSAQFDSARFDSAPFGAGRQRGPDDEPWPRGVPRDGDVPGAGDPPASLFGQITIYTLLEDRIEEFDRLTELVVEEVRAREPGTLVYIVHAVPTAPMQRILYEVYRNRSAYDEHMVQPYMTRYVAERRTMVLATNAIELGLQQAKVTPLPSYSAISDLLSESGIDLTGVTRSSRGAAPGRSGQRESPGRGDDRYGRDPGDAGFGGDRGYRGDAGYESAGHDSTGYGYDDGYDSAGYDGHAGHGGYDDAGYDDAGPGGWGGGRPGEDRYR